MQTYFNRITTCTLWNFVLNKFILSYLKYITIQFSLDKLFQIEIYQHSSTQRSHDEQYHEALSHVH